MTQPSLAGCIEKLRRAEEHLKLLREEAELFAHSNAYDFTHRFNRKTKRYSILLDLPPGPPRLGVLIGDVAHNLRSCLDHLVWQLVITNGEEPKSGPGGNQFPILTWKPKPSFWRHEHTRQLAGVSRTGIAMIERMQPYRVGARRHRHLLAVLQDINNTDKHQLVLGTQLWLPGGKPDISLEPNADAGPVVNPTIRTGVPLTDNTELIWMRLPEAGPNPHVHVHGNFALRMGLDNGMPVVPALGYAGRTINDALGEFAEACF